MVEKAMNKAVYVIELVVAGVLVLLSILALLGLALAVIKVINSSIALTPVHFNEVISLVLEVFILIELFRIALAYMSHRNVIPTVLEAALVAVARKFVVFEPTVGFLTTAGGLAALLLAVSGSWWLLSRSNACELIENTEESPA